MLSLSYCNKNRIARFLYFIANKIFLGWSRQKSIKYKFVIRSLEKIYRWLRIYLQYYLISYAHFGLWTWMHNTALLARITVFIVDFFPHSPLLTACHHSSLIRTHRCNLTTKFNDPLVLIFLESRRILSHSRSPSGWAARRRARTRPVRVITRHTLAHTGSDAICTNPRPRRTTGGSVSHSWHGRVYFDQSQISIKHSAATWYLNKYLNI